MAFLGATAVVMVVQRFLPELKAVILDFAGLPMAPPSIAFVLALMVLGLMVQALWWVIRRR